MKTNDPVRVKNAWIRFIAALVAAVLLLAVSGFGVFKMLGKPKSLFPEIDWMSMTGSMDEAEMTGAQPGDYVEHEVSFIIKNFAEGARGDTVHERYAAVPVNGKLVAFRFPQRWLASEQAIADESMNVLTGVSQYFDKYIVVRGTVQALPEDVAAEFYSWFGENKEWMAQCGLISGTEDAAAAIDDYMVAVDAVGSRSAGTVVGLSVAALVCLLYALYELIRILAKGYAPKALPEEELPEPISGGEAGDDSDVEVEITELDPETGEDVTDVEVEIIEEDPETGEDVTDLEVEIVEETPGTAVDDVVLAAETAAEAKREDADV